MHPDIDYTYRTVGNLSPSHKIEKSVDHEMLIEPEMKAAHCGDFLLGLPARASGPFAYRAKDI
jgi:hypothetical protein